MDPHAYETYLTKLGPIGLTFVLVIAAGYVIRLLPFIANRYIPLLAPLIGGAVLPLIAPTEFAGTGWRHPVAVLVIYGLIVGVVAWSVHAVIIRRLEDWVRSKIPAVDRAFDATADQPKDRP